jgi:hypothetical protein
VLSSLVSGTQQFQMVELGNAVAIDQAVITVLTGRELLE